MPDWKPTSACDLAAARMARSSASDCSEATYVQIGVRPEGGWGRQQALRCCGRPPALPKLLQKWRAWHRIPMPAPLLTTPTRRSPQCTPHLCALPAHLLAHPHLTLACSCAARSRIASSSEAKSDVAACASASRSSAARSSPPCVKACSSARRTAQERMRHQPVETT
jgi:hypothetical protein